jgi:hypothetical protein
MTDQSASNDHSELRHYPRVQAGQVVAVKPLAARQAELEVAAAKVVGLGGLMFESPVQRQKGDLLELTILAGAEPITLQVVVSWCRREDGDLWHVGVQFQDITEVVRTKILDSLMRRVSLEEQIQTEE